MPRKQKHESSLINTVQNRVNQFKRYCLTSGDQESRAWIFSEGPPSRVIQGTRSFGSMDSPFNIHLIDLYHGRTPTLVNHTTLKKGPDVQIGLKPLIMLDSNAISYIDRFLAGNTSNVENQVIADFIKFAKSRGMDFSPVFYSIESLSRSDQASWYDYALSFSETHLNLQVLDLELLLEKGRLASSIKAKDAEVKFHDASGVDDLLEKYTHSVDRRTALSESVKVKKSYACLLKAAVLRRSKNNIEGKYKKLTEFMINKIGQVLGLERTFALLHWLAPEHYSALLPVLQKGVNLERFFSKVSSTAWDFYLGRLPENIGRFASELADHEGSEATCNLIYIATAEERLAEVLSQRSIELLIQHPDQSKSDRLVGQRMNLLKEHCESEAQFRQLFDFVNGYELDLQESRREGISVSQSHVSAIVDSLESEVKGICRPSTR